MKKVKNFLMIFTFLILVVLTNSSLAKSEDYLVLKKSNGEYIVYIEEYLKDEFEFAYSNLSTSLEEELNFINNAKDQIDGYNVAYISQNNFENYFEDDGKAFVFVKMNDTVISTLEVDLSQDVVLEENVEFVKNTTQRIATKTDKILTETKEENGIKYTTTTGKLTITDDKSATYYYRLEKMPSTNEYTRFFELAEKIDAGTKVDVIEDLKLSQEFLNLYNNLMPQNWENVENMTINQPADSDDGDKYIVWLKKEKENDVVEDVQFLLATKEESEKYVKDIHQEQQLVAQPVKEVSLFNGAITLPVTYDSMALFVILGVLVAVLVVVIILKKKSKKEENKN